MCRLFLIALIQFAILSMKHFILLQLPAQVLLKQIVAIMKYVNGQEVVQVSVMILAWVLKRQLVKRKKYANGQVIQAIVLQLVVLVGVKVQQQIVITQRDVCGIIVEDLVPIHANVREIVKVGIIVFKVQ